MNENKYTFPKNEERLTIEEMSFESTHLILLMRGPNAAEFNLKDKTNFGNIFTWSEFQILTIIFFITDGTF